MRAAPALAPSNRGATRGDVRPQAACPRRPREIGGGRAIGRRRNDRCNRHALRSGVPVLHVAGPSGFALTAQDGATSPAPSAKRYSVADSSQWGLRAVPSNMLETLYFSHSPFAPAGAVRARIALRSTAVSASDR
jgi:hypothetical protein